MSIPVDPSFIKLVETISSNSTGPLVVGIGEVARRVFPRAMAQLAAKEFMNLARGATPLWRWVAGPNPSPGAQIGTAARGTSLAGVGGLALTLGVPIVVAVGVWVMLGSGYYIARKEVRRKGLMTGFAHGFVTAVHKWTFEQTLTGFLKRFVVNTNTWDSAMDREETLGYNEGLIKGWGIGDAVPEDLIRYKHAIIGPYSGELIPYGGWVTDEELKRNPNKTLLIPVKVDKKKSFRIALRRIANNHFSGPWSVNEYEKKLQQSSYVRELGGKALQHGLLVSE